MKPFKQHWTETTRQCYEHGLNEGAIQLSLFNPVQTGVKFMPDCATCPVYTQFYNYKCSVHKEVQRILENHGPPREVMVSNKMVVATSSDITHKPLHWKIFAFINANPGVTYSEIYQHFKSEVSPKVNKDGKTISPSERIYSALKMGAKKGCLLKDKKGHMNQYHFTCDQAHCLKRKEFSQIPIIQN